MMESPTYGNRPRVLIVDDEPSICKALEIALGRAGFEAIATRCGEAAITKLSTEHFDALLLDLRIPDMRGDVLFELAVAHQPHLRAQTLFITGDITDHAQELIEACGCPFLLKPFNLADIFDTLHAMTPRVHHASA
jgi:DNA-binding NtrC family response regulator